MGGAQKSSNKADTDKFLKDFDIFEDHPIVGSKFKFYLKRPRRAKRRVKKKK